MNGEAVQRIRRIAVAVDSSAPSLAATREMAQLAARLRAELAGLFVEDINLLHLSGLPFVREVGTFSAARRTLAGETLPRMLRGQATRAEQALAQRAQAFGVPWTFQVSRGEVAPELLAAAAEADLLALGLVRHVRELGTNLRAVLSTSQRPILLLREGVVLRPPVTILLMESSPVERMMALATQIRFDGDEIVRVWLRAGSEEGLARLEQRLAAATEPGNMVIEQRRVGETKVRLDVRQQGVLMLSLPRDNAERSLHEFICRSECALLLVR